MLCDEQASDHIILKTKRDSNKENSINIHIEDTTPSERLQPTRNDDDLKESTATANENKCEILSKSDEECPYHTEGWKNPGWFTTVGRFLITFATVGIQLSWGTFQPFYLEQVYPNQTDVFHIAFIGTSSFALMQSSGFPVGFIIRRIGYRSTTLIGAILCPLALFLASIATQLWHTILTHGILFGIGAAFCFSGTAVLPSQWFFKHRSLVNGIARTALSRPRYSLSSSPSTPNHQNNDTSSLGFLCNAPFALYLAFVLFASFGYLIPFYLMPTYAMQVVGTSASTGSLLVSLGSACIVISRIGLGLIADRLGIINVLFTATLLSGIFTMVLWKFSYTLVTYSFYCALIGLTSSLYISTVSPMAVRLLGMQHLYVGTSLAWMSTSIGVLLGTPFFGRLLAERGWSFAIQFTGAIEFAAALCMLATRFLLDQRLISKI
ncbi:MFS general substrate transporter [Lichtheimia hyalospora FSU 10163]|nr:MFS general substrate transporter [Lichtheimia hyalospora FSU 10163]